MGDCPCPFVGSALGREPPDSDVVLIIWSPIGPRVNVHTDPWIIAGPTGQLAEWTVWYSLVPMNPTAITIAAGQIRLVNATWINPANISQVGYTPGPVRYTNTYGGILPGGLWPYPFP